MSSAANNMRGKLEEDFQRHMYDAEASPPADLWARIDHDLTVQENTLYKKRVVFYRQLAAACLALLLVAGGFTAFYWSGHTTPGQEVATVQPADLTGGDVAESLLVESGAATEEEPSEATEVDGSHSLATAVPSEENPHGQKEALEGTAKADIANFNSETTTRITNSRAVQGIVLAESTEEPLIGENKKESVPALSDLLYHSPRQMIAAVPVERESSKQASSPFAVDGASRVTNKDFLELNKQVMDRAKVLAEKQEAMLLAFNDEAEARKNDRQKSSSGDERWSLGMAYVPSFFEQNVGISGQRLGASSRMSLIPADFSAVTASMDKMEEAREEFTESTDPGFSFSFEVKTGFKLAEKLKLLAGLGFSQNSARSKSSYVVEQFWEQPESGERVSPGPTTIFLPSIKTNFATDSISVAKTDAFNVNYRYRHLIIPVGLQYEDNLGKEWFWYGGAGVAANILIETSIMASVEDVKDVSYNMGDDSPFRKLQWSGNASAGVGKRLSNNMSVTVGPEFRGYFDTLLSNPERAQAPQGKPYTVGLNMAVSYDLSAR